MAQRDGLLTPEQEEAVDALAENDMAILQDGMQRLNYAADAVLKAGTSLAEGSPTMGANAQSRPAYTDQELLRALLRTDLYTFTQKVFETVVPGVTFSRNWSTEAVTHALEKVARGETTRLIINIPPRHLKSICASVALPAFLLGHDPTRKVICVSYSDDLAVKFSNDCRAVMQAEWYNKPSPTPRSIGPRTPRPSSGRPSAGIVWRRPSAGH